ncbi:MAG TPA: dTDP-4-amino-4,6-dideoxygalactose transaminase [Bacteroidota bacterium]|nr:dTDP-4-amino-4,6-dideoxygalactose transaminase [Bacteroidota bacterium]
MNIPFNKPFLSNNVLAAIQRVLESGKLSGDGAFCQQVEQRIEQLFHVRHALLTTSGTHALETAMMLLNLQPGDEVLTPSFTFVSTANAIIRCGGKPVFCEINNRTLTMDVRDTERKISKRTKAIVPVHYAGVAAEMDELCALARAHRCWVVEDAAQGVNAQYKNKFLGTIGSLGAYSFHDTKNYICGEGGALLTNDEQLARRAEIIREKGTNRSNFLRGEVDKYTWVDLGSSYVLSEILAAVLNDQFDDLETIQRRREAIHRSYMAGLVELEQQEKIRLPIIPDYCSSNYHLFYILLPTEERRNFLLNQLKAVGIGTTFHYIPLHSSPYAQKVLGLNDFKLPVTDTISSTLLRLPMYPQLSDDDVHQVIEQIKKNLH